MLININLLRFFILLIFLFAVSSCNKIEFLDEIVFDYNQLPKFVFTAEQKELKETYEVKFSDPFIDYSLPKPPKSKRTALRTSPQAQTAPPCPSHPLGSRTPPPA